MPLKKSLEGPTMQMLLLAAIALTITYLYIKLMH
jgi:hypothetical protein